MDPQAASGHHWTPSGPECWDCAADLDPDDVAASALDGYRLPVCWNCRTRAREVLDTIRVRAGLRPRVLTVYVIDHQDDDPPIPGRSRRDDVPEQLALDDVLEVTGIGQFELMHRVRPDRNALQTSRTRHQRLAELPAMALVMPVELTHAYGAGHRSESDIPRAARAFRTRQLPHN